MFELGDVVRVKATGREHIIVAITYDHTEQWLHLDYMSGLYRPDDLELSVAVTKDGGLTGE